MSTVLSEQICLAFCGGRACVKRVFEPIFSLLTLFAVV